MRVKNGDCVGVVLKIYFGSQIPATTGVSPYGLVG